MILAKLATLAIAPLGVSIAIGFFGAGLSVLNSPRLSAWGRRLMIAALCWLLFWSLPVVSETLRGAIEARSGERLIERLPQADALVVLGGGVTGPRPPHRPHPDLGKAADRLWHAARIYHAGKAPWVIVSGGETPTGDGSEAQAMRELLLEWGVPDSVIVLEDQSQNTASNAINTAKLLLARDLEQPMLVTSALHMPRAVALFEKAGIAVIPAPTDFEVIYQPRGLLQWLPNSEALDGSGRAFKELLGVWLASSPLR